MSDPLADTSAILNELGAYIFTKDRAGRYVYANDLVQQLFGLPLDEIVGKDDSAFFDLKRSDDLRVNDEIVMSTGEIVRAREVDVLEETGEARVYWTVKAPVRDASGTVIGMCGMSVNITEMGA